MIGISRQTDYATRLVLHLACLEEAAQVTIAEIALDRLLPVAFIRRLVGRLTRAGILASSRGAGGGIRLARPAATITLLEVVEAMEGRIVLNECLLATHSCPLSSGCPVQAAWADVSCSLREQLASVSFQSLAENTANHVAGHRNRHLDSRRGRERRSQAG